MKLFTSGVFTKFRTLLVKPSGMSPEFLGGATPEFAHVERTTGWTATGTFVTIITCPPVWFDGRTKLRLEFFAPHVTLSAVGDLRLRFFDNTTDLLGVRQYGDNGWQQPCSMLFYTTPTQGWHTYTIQGRVAGGSASISAGSGALPMFLRVVGVVR